MITHAASLVAYYAHLAVVKGTVKCLIVAKGAPAWNITVY